MTTAESTLPEADLIAPSPPPKRGLAALFVGIVFKPLDTFAYLRDHGGRTWLVPLALAVVLTLAFQAVARPIQRAQAEAAFAAVRAQSGQANGGAPFSGAGAAGGQGGSGAFQSNPTSDSLYSYALPAGGVVGEWAARGLVLLVLAWLLGGRPSAGSLFRLSGWALVPTIARLMVGIALMVVAGRIPAQGLSRAFQQQSPAITTSSGAGAPAGGGVRPGGGMRQGNLMPLNPFGARQAAGGGASFISLLRNGLLSALDIYTLWALALTGIGVAVTARLSWIRSGIVTLGQWAIGLGLGTLPQLIAFALGGLVGGQR